MKNVLRKIVLFDKVVGPDQPHQLILFHHLAIALDQDEQRVEDFGRKRYRLSVADQRAADRIELKEIEFINAPGFVDRSHIGISR